MKVTIRPATSNDADDISRIVIAALRETNAKDYSEAVIARVEQGFSPVSVFELLTKRLVFVAEGEDGIVGTASLDGRVVRTVFVAPKHQGIGIGKALMAAVEMEAVEQEIAALTVPSSVTAEKFYAKLGFTAVRESYHGDERTIIMERALLRPTKGA
ncbi:GNAT family N-acetyltransferase [Methylobacterium terricola]|uniref:GNAT family N-acetyltransferase n=1 Tax=Methylobacterium terricola TaxID=2583531 RepID=A0A5C4LNX4_9HYPH|nr:GNAT family N-acetyltransferase [Methylobacterium terricola]TNC15950.1 GNAT family N-acetyltransferase [Methylobacterium terricola]